MPPKAAKRVPTVPKAQSTIPPPFTTTPSSLKPLVQALNRRYVYITHIDVHPSAYKRRIFLIPIVLNAIFAILIFLRIYYAVPKYLSLLAATLGYAGPDAIDTKTTPWSTLISSVLTRGLMLGGDWLLIRIVGSWPYTFFFEGPENACTWRAKCGFREREVVVRMSRRWGVEELMQGTKKGGESPFWKTKVLPAVDPEWNRAKTGYLMMGKDWDLDFPAMVAVQKAVDQKELSEQSVDGLLLAWNGKSETDGEWVSCRFKEEDTTPVVATSTKDEYGQTEEEGAKQMLMVRDKLADMGKEALFFRMIELAQYEGSVPGRSQQDRERITLEEVQKLFSNNGVDFAKMMEELELDWPGLGRPS